MKKILAALLLGAALAVAALPVSAQGVDSTVTMTAKGDAAAVRLDLPESTAQGVKALRLSFQVDSSEPVNAEFAFDKSLPGTVQEYRYDSDTGRMDVYVAGRDEILPTGTADLGQIKVDVSQTGTATVRLVENSLELVNGALGVTSTSTSSNGEAALEPETPSAPATPKPESPSQPSGTVTVTSDSDSDDQENTAQTEVVLTNPTLNPSGTQTGNSGSTGNTGNTGSAAEDSQQSPEPDASPAPESTKTPAAEEEQSAATSSPEQAETEQNSEAKLPLVPILVVAALAVAGIIGVAVIRFRR